MSTCKNCRGNKGIHHYQTMQCPVGGREAPVSRKQEYMTTTYEEESFKAKRVRDLISQFDLEENVYPPMQIDERLKYYRKIKGMKLRELSERTGLSISFLSEIHRGITTPSLPTCQKLANAYGVSLSLLFSGVEVHLTKRAANDLEANVKKVVKEIGEENVLGVQYIRR